MTKKPDIRAGVSRQDTALDGQRFGRLTVLRKHSTKHRSYERVWLCRCDCGNEVAKRGASLKGAGLKHCGCECLKRGMVPNTRAGRMGFVHTKQSLLLADIRRRAKLAGYECNLTVEDLDAPAFCPAIGIRLDWHAGIRADALPSVDKIDPAGGYVRGNVAIISLRANRLKNNATLAEVEGIARYIRDQSRSSASQPSRA